jgi:hypothetical protein
MEIIIKHHQGNECRYERMNDNKARWAVGLRMKVVDEL